MSDFAKTRLIGLDMVRAFAILCVLASHGVWLLPNAGAYQAWRFGGQFGVELFFVLSGFLIGTILLKACEQGLSSRTIVHFWARRWMRTLPAYFAVLLFIAAAFGRFDPAYFLFLQGPVRGDFSLLPVSWSLVTEEWFYLSFPLLLAPLVTYAPRQGFLLAATLFIGVSFIHHLHLIARCEQADFLKCFDATARKNGLRFFNIALGALLAYGFHRFLFAERIQNCKLGFAATSLVLFGLTIINTLAFLANPAMFPPALLLPLMGICSAFMIACLYVWQPVLPVFLSRLITFISLTSYSNYLWHMLMRDIIAQHMAQGKSALLLYIIGSFLAAFASYACIERPFLRLRDRVVP